MNRIWPLLLLIPLIISISLSGCLGSPHFVLISGAGSTFLAPQLEKWISEFEERDPLVQISYDPVGSGAGQRLLFDHVVSFAGSDPPLSKETWEKYRGKILQLPIILGGVAVVYNLPGVKHLKLSGEVLAEIFSGQISKWDSPQIEELNPGVNLPNKPIIVVHRSDASGTTQIFTTFLHKAAPNIWPSNLVGKTISWKIDETGRGIASQGNQGVSSTVMKVKYSIGYVSYEYALEYGMEYAAIENPLGQFVLPSPQNITLAAKGISLPSSPLGDFSQVLSEVVYSKTPGAYPISSFSFLMLWREVPKEKLRPLREFLYFINTEGQKTLMAGYAPIPKEVEALNLKAISLLEAKK